MKTLLQLENFLLLIVTLFIYSWIFEYSLPLLLVLLFIFDLSMLGYLFNEAIGDICYNIFHHLTIPIALLLTGIYYSYDSILSFSLIWLIHIFMDRALGFGLKQKMVLNQPT